MRRSRMPRGTKALARKTEMEQVGRKRREAAEVAGEPVKPALSTRIRPAVPDAVRKRLKKRSRGNCEMQLTGCTGTATDPAHRIGQGMGGRHGASKVAHDQLSNLLHACRTCHEWTHHRDAEAKDLGLRLENGQVPTRESVVYRGARSYLTDNGKVLDFEEGDALLFPMEALMGAGEETF